MKKFIGIAIKSLLALVVLGVLGLLALGVFFNPERMKPMVVSYVQEQYKRTISIGDVSWRVFPRLGISIKDISLSNAPGFGEGNFAVLKSATVFVKTLELFTGKVRVTTLQLQGPSADLKINAQGASNWADLTEAKKAPESKTTAAESSPSSGISNLEFHIENIEIIEGAFTYQDQKTGEKYAISGLNLSSQNVALGQDFPVDLKLKIASNAPSLDADIRAKGKMRVAANTNYDLQALTLQGDLTIPSLQANGIRVSNLKTPLTLEKGVLNLSALSANLYGGTVNGSMRVDAASQPADVTVNYEMRGTDITSMTRDMGVKQSFSGKLNMKGNLRFKSYPEKKQMTSSMTGTANMNIHNGALNGVDLAYWYSTGLNLMKSRNIAQLGAGAVQAVAGLANAGKTEFLGAQANFNLNKGILSTKDLIVYTAKVLGAAAGTINLTNETIDFRFNLSGVSIAGSQVKPAGEVIPLTITGSLNNPKMNLEMGAVVGNVLKNVLPQQGTQNQNTKGGIGGAILQGILQ
jgi:AsmA protein